MNVGGTTKGGLKNMDGMDGLKSGKSREVTWEEIERTLASGSPQDTLAHLQSIDQMLSAIPQAPPPSVTVQGVDDFVFHFDYTRELPANLNMDLGDSKKESVLTMRSQAYADVLDCFSPIFAESSCVTDASSSPSSHPLPTRTHTSSHHSTPSHISTLSHLSTPLHHATPSDLLVSLKGRAKDEVVPLLLSSSLPSATKVDVALQFFANET